MNVKMVSLIQEGEIEGYLLRHALILFPGLQLPLHIFEPRYRAMVSDARLITSAW